MGDNQVNLVVYFFLRLIVDSTSKYNIRDYTLHLKSNNKKLYKK
jgi:L-rhamnose mutarotase